MLFQKFEFVLKEYTAHHYFNGRLFDERVIGIGIYNKKLKTTFPSPLTNFIKSQYRCKNGSLSSQRNASYEVIKFLNHLINQIEINNKEFTSLSSEGLFGLKLIHGSSYISYQSLRAREGELSANYIYRIESYLIKFYKWLSTSYIIKEEIDETNGSPFDDIQLGTIYPRKDEEVKEKLVDFGDNRYDLLLKFINIARMEAPEIVLGICFQFFGGLRVGEVVNITKDSIEYPYYWDERDYGKEKFILKIRDRQKQLFENKVNLQHEQVKRPRNQSLLISTVLSEIYKEHKKYLVKIESTRNIKNTKALFISSKTGYPISGKSYKDKFQKVKSAFLSQISEENNIKDYFYLTSKLWSTHICRGVFTNLLLHVGATIPEIAIARGDKDINAALDYVEEINAIKIMNTAMNDLQKSYKEEVREAFSQGDSTINQSIQEKFKEGDVNQIE